MSITRYREEADTNRAAQQSKRLPVMYSRSKKPMNQPKPGKQPTATPCPQKTPSMHQPSQPRSIRLPYIFKCPCRAREGAGTGACPTACDRSTTALSPRAAGHGNCAGRRDASNTLGLQPAICASSTGCSELPIHPQRQFIYLGRIVA